ncbi:hypothetical protein V6Z11_A11G002900 [Gossypium hirsutum]
MLIISSRKMENKFFFSLGTKKSTLIGKNNIIAMKKASFSSSSSSSPQVSSKSKCSESLVEFCCSACFFCIFCPLSVVWCCAKLPCKVAGYVIKWACNYCKTDNKVFAEYSSFSDIDLDDMPSLPHKSSPTHSFHPFSCACTRTRHRSSSN